MRTLDQMIAQEVHYCVSYLVSTLANAVAYDATYGHDLADLASQALDLAAPIDDWEEAATQEGWRHDSNGFYLAHDFGAIEADSWQDLCEREGLEPYQREVFEHWIVSDWLADKLAEHGEKVDKDFAGMTVWARATTGQGIASDSVMEAIYAELMAA